MAESIESFVEKLQVEGVQVGQEAAEKIRTEAQQQAQQILKQASAEAEKIIADAKSQSEATLVKCRSELELAARDTILTLREKLRQMLQTVLIGPVEEHLNNPEFLAPLMHDIVVQYAQADSGKAKKIEINVSPQLSNQLAEWVVKKLRTTAENNKIDVDFRETLVRAGFEYKLGDGTVDITAETVAETLAKFVGAHLEELLKKATDSEKS